MNHIRKEVAYSHRIFSQIKGLQVIDVTNSSIEEVANKIIESRQEVMKRSTDKKRR